MKGRRAVSEELASTVAVAPSRPSSRATVRAAGIADIPVLLELGRRNHAQSRFGYMTFDNEKSTLLAQRLLSDPRRYALLVVERDGQAVGYICGQIGEALFSRDLLATILMYYVLPSARNGKAAVRLLQAFREWARRRGAREVDIHVTSGVYIARTDRFLRRLGFRQIGGNYVSLLENGAAAGGQGTAI